MTLSPQENETQPLVSVVMPCLNEEKALGICIEKIRKTLTENNIDGEIVVSDNGSTDRSVEIATSMGTRVCHQPLRGYGNAYLKGFEHARGKYLIMADADDTYDLTMIPQFLSELQSGNYDFVTGSRYLGKGEKHITWLHRYVGNPILTMLLNIFFGTRYSDVYCGYRAFTREAFDKIRPVSPGMEFNLELAINASLSGLRIKEIPIILGPRLGESKLNTFSDGWRSLRMMLIYAPNKVFLIPGLFLFISGMLLHLVVMLRLIQSDGRALGVVSAMMALTMSVTGFQVLSLWLHAKTYSWSRRFDRNNTFVLGFYKLFKLETGLMAGFLLTLIGTVIMGVLVLKWFHLGLMPLPRPEFAAFASTLIIIGLSCIFSSLFISAMSMSKGEP
ncbi:MAG: glycosyltransferase family 2 protein [Cyanobacteria bacterium SZAS LIN-2]|nr:glycosyltransferase family 2 protein [Cyanobacteria bacterium SZAS LIN-3]MBS1996007.1 glycosyltransferase family 2 protein [Cyanobacteria bacterium SZAS LIN-2]